MIGSCHFTEAERRSIARFVSRCCSGRTPHIVRDANMRFGLNQDARMKSVNELLELFMRQSQLEEAMRRPGGARVTEERELLAVRRQIARLPETMAVALRSAAARPGTAKSDRGIDGC
jgi:hypothetical protein